MTDWKRVMYEAANDFENLQTAHDELGDDYSFQAGYKYAIANDPRVKALFSSANEVDSIATLIKKSNGKNTNLLFDLDDAHKRLSQALKAFEGSGE